MTKPNFRIIDDTTPKKTGNKALTSIRELEKNYGRRPTRQDLRRYFGTAWNAGIENAVNFYEKEGQLHEELAQATDEYKQRLDEIKKKYDVNLNLDQVKINVNDTRKSRIERKGNYLVKISYDSEGHQHNKFVYSPKKK